MDLTNEGQTVDSYFEEHSREGVLLLCTSSKGDATAHLERDSYGGVELVAKGGRWPVGDLGILGLWQIICWVENKASVIS